ncbi:MAG: hypothetical protein AAGA57_07950 [Planctomycetota bacterium]
MTRAVRAWALVLLVVGAALGHTACDSGANPPDAAAPGALRIVSLTPSLTQLCVEMGLGDRIVGVTRYDAFRGVEGGPQVAVVTDHSVAGVASVAPTHVLTTVSPSLPVPSAIQRLADRGAFALGAYAYPASLDDVVACLVETDRATGSPAMGTFLGKQESARALADKIQAERAKLRGAATGPRLRVLLLFEASGASGAGGYRASGPGTVLDEALRLAGHVNALEGRVSGEAGSATVTAPRLTLAAIADLAPDAVVVFDPGGAAFSGVQDSRLTALRGVPMPAVGEGRLWVETDARALLPSLATLDLAGRLAAWLAGESP